MSGGTDEFSMIAHLNKPKTLSATITLTIEAPLPLTGLCYCTNTTLPGNLLALISARSAAILIYSAQFGFQTAKLCGHMKVGWVAVVSLESRRKPNISESVCRHVLGEQSCKMLTEFKAHISFTITRFSEFWTYFAELFWLISLLKLSWCFGGDGGRRSSVCTCLSNDARLPLVFVGCSAY